MSDFGVWESVETSDSEKKIASQKSQDKLAAAIYDVKDKYGDFLYASTALDEFHDRVALVKTDMMKTVDQHLMPVTGVMRRVIKACKDEWRTREAVHPHAPARGAEPLVSGREWGWSGDFPDDELLQHLYEEGLSGHTPEEAKFLTYKDLMEEPPPGYARGDVAPYDERLSRRRQATGFNGGGDGTGGGQIGGAAGNNVGSFPANDPWVGTPTAPEESGSALTDAAKGLPAFTGTPTSSGTQFKNSRRRLAGDSVRMKNIPECDICKYENGKSGVPAAYDGKTQYGPWANMCEDHFKSHGVGLGTGKGQRFTSTRRLAYDDAPPRKVCKNPRHKRYQDDVGCVDCAEKAWDRDLDPKDRKHSNRRRADYTGPNISTWGSSDEAIGSGSGVASVQGIPGQAGVEADGVIGKSSRRRRADNTGPAMDLEETFEPSGDVLVPEGNFDGYLAEVEQGAPEKAGENFIESRRRQAIIDGKTCTCEPHGGSYEIRDRDCPLTDEQHRRQSEHEKEKKASRLAFSVYKDYCETNGLRVASIDSLDHYAENLSDAQYFRLASIIERIATQPLPGGGGGSDSGTPSSGTAPGFGGAMGEGGIAEPWQPGTGPLQQNMIAPGQIAASRRQAAGAGKTNYLQKADEALTQVLESKAEEFQETIAPLQQALQVIQQAEQAEQAANPMGVQPPPGTVNVLPGQDPSAGGGDPSMGGGDPSMGGGDPSGGGELSGGDLAQALGLAGAQGQPTPGMEGAQQQITGRQRRRKKANEEEHPDIIRLKEKHPYGGMDDGRFDPDLYRPSGTIYGEDDGELDEYFATHPGEEEAFYESREEPTAIEEHPRFEDLFETQQIHRADHPDSNVDWDECPECAGAVDPELLDLAKQFRAEMTAPPRHASRGGRRSGGAYPFVREGGILDQYNSWLKKRKDLPRGGEADYWAFARENGFGENEVNSLKKHFQTTAAKVSLSDGEMGSYPRTSGVRGQRSGASPVGGSNRSSSTRESNPSRQGASAGGRKARLSNRNTGNPRASDDSLSGGSGVSWSQTGEARGTASQRSGSRQSSGEPGVWDQGSEHAGHGRSRHAVVPEENSMSRRASAGRAESSGFPVEAGLEVMQGVSGRTQMGQASSWDGGSDRSRSVLSENNVRKLAWSGFGFGPSSFQPKVAGWIWDSHLNGYIANAANRFACSCGESFDVPSYHNCKCGKIYNSYVIGTGGDNHTASIEKYICREIQVRPDVIVANRKAKRHNLTEPGGLDDGEEDDLPTMKPVSQDWRRRNEHGQFSAKRR